MLIVRALDSMRHASKIPHCYGAPSLRHRISVALPGEQKENTDGPQSKSR
jgi:hypothetical protein